MSSLPWLTLDEACKVLRVGRTRAIQNAKATGYLDKDQRIPVLRINGTYRIAAADLRLRDRDDLPDDSGGRTEQ